jgi:hypothetical protein
VTSIENELFDFVGFVHEELSPAKELGRKEEPLAKLLSHRPRGL